MPVTLSIENAPEQVVERLRQRAARNHRSLQGELMAIIEIAAQEPERLSALEMVEFIRELGLQTPSESMAMVRADRDRH